MVALIRSVAIQVDHLLAKRVAVGRVTGAAGGFKSFLRGHRATLVKLSLQPFPTGLHFRAPTKRFFGCRIYTASDSQKQSVGGLPCQTQMRICRRISCGVFTTSAQWPAFF